jgi:hypothetical protein
MCGYGLDWYSSGQDPVAGFCEHGNESWRSLEGGRFLYHLSDS